MGDVWETLESPTIEELLARLDEAEQVLEPGRWWHYSNLAFALLGEVVARRAGEPYRDVVQAQILDPLGLVRTTWDPVEPRARGCLPGGQPQARGSTGSHVVRARPSRSRIRACTTSR